MLSTLSSFSSSSSSSSVSPSPSSSSSTPTPTSLPPPHSSVPPSSQTQTPTSSPLPSSSSPSSQPPTNLDKIATDHPLIYWFVANAINVHCLDARLGCAFGPFGRVKREGAGGRGDEARVKEGDEAQVKDEDEGNDMAGKEKDRSKDKD
ncbi:hypothetical protein JR316_0012384 [Psilocybe cubensis]|uniref:Uncharacterized protein n=2 Tax=Psilocybe cubensis TaxID=181762 RepID=A0ACB8GI88_PSICU|nr:hypothetical protein JR316_0012384 [Psilocybe cubensis]KAH9475273.1 hypothetical protein JR316_0012384 [Psilocybe cubensis]